MEESELNQHEMFKQSCEWGVKQLLSHAKTALQEVGNSVAPTNAEIIAVAQLIAMDYRTDALCHTAKEIARHLTDSASEMVDRLS